MKTIINLLEETIEALKENGKSPADVEWVGVRDDHYETWEEFEKKAKDINYDNGYGFEMINTDLVVVGKDFWLERFEYDGSEWWVFKTFPKKPKDTIGQQSIYGINTNV